jgi:hypothetical protein
LSKVNRADTHNATGLNRQSSRSQWAWFASSRPITLIGIGVLLLFLGAGVNNANMEYRAENYGASPGLLPALLVDLLFLGGLALIVRGIVNAVQRGKQVQAPGGLVDDPQRANPLASWLFRERDPKKIAAAEANSRAAKPPTTPTTAPLPKTMVQVQSIGAQIDELYELHARGILTPDELDVKTAALLKRTQ